ncbi:uncharacterized protein EDB93DRAFT_1105087 [Suillus bovinus]|uniref:uncharacterized protein n=1 Tax=Suillus bovinus TaxID=48563 RepID=UPI001B87CA71|nr:uncharacterized protein EDB93DRAFT_1105087 [Suillus bovinus]KAG2143743.1 hypothetical protein EDB93DRAFT_1105087 [Suillus bovinus]
MTLRVIKRNYKTFYSRLFTAHTSNFILVYLHGGIAMGKYDHIPELLGTENYVGWSTKMQYALACEDLWCHVNTNPDPTDILGAPSFKPVPVDPNNVTPAEVAVIREWLLNDMKAKDLITCCLSPSVGALVSRTHTVSSRDAWKTLAEHFNCTDTSAQYQLQQ